MAAGLLQGLLKVKYKAKFHVQLMISTKATTKNQEYIQTVTGLNNMLDFQVIGGLDFLNIIRR